MRKILALALSLISIGVASETLFDSPNDKEVAYFFTYHCGACYKVNGALSAWESISNQPVKRIPVIKDEWLFGAHLHFLLEVSKGLYSLTDYERHTSAYSIVANTTNIPHKDYEFAALLREYGMQFSPLDFNKWWNIAQVMVLSSKEIQAGIAEIAIAPPMLRVANGNDVIWISIDRESEHPEVKLLKDLNVALGMGSK